MSKRERQKNEDSFLREYRKLNLEQKKAVDSIEGPIMVIAGPGTGKTQVLTLRIANILQRTDTPPEAILALTFTEKATFQMRNRLAGIIGQDAYRVRIRTFHGFCNELIQSEPDMFPHIIGGSVITNIDQLGLLEDIVTSGNFPLLRPIGRPEAFIKAISGAIEHLKREGVGVKEFENAVKKEEKIFSTIDDLLDKEGNIRAKYRTEDKRIRKQWELTKIYRSYQNILSQSNLYDYADMLVDVMRILEHDEQFLRSLQERILYILVDEHQDTNFTQNRIVQLISEYHEQPNLFVVGDLQQAIYRFQGASLENFQSFMRRYTDAVIIRLEKNYRSTQAVLESAAGISPSQGALKAISGHKEQPVRLYEFSSPDVQEYSVAGMAQKFITDGVKPQDIAVLFRTNAEISPFAEMFGRLDVPFAVESDDDVLRDPHIQRLLSVAYAVKEIGDSGALLKALGADFLNFEPLDLYKLSAYSRKIKRNPWDVIRSKKLIAKMNPVRPERIMEIYGIFSFLARTMRNQSAPLALETLVRETGFLTHIQKLTDGERVLGKLHALFGLVRAQMEINNKMLFSDFLNIIERLERHNSTLKSQASLTESAVRLMTVHKAKGLEFDIVFIANATHEHWEGVRKPANLKLPSTIWRISEKVLDELEDDTENDIRKLFYVALTRARKEARITWAGRKSDGKEQLPSTFVLSLPEKFIKKEGTSSWDDKYEKARTKRFDIRTRRVPLKDKEFLNDMFCEQGLSVTALNNYLECPWRFFYANLLRIPEAPSIPSEYGKAAHSAMRAFFGTQKKTKKDPGANYLIKHFEKVLSGAPLPEREIKGALRKGKQMLSGYHDTYCDSWHTDVVLEERIDGIDIADIPISGQLDKLEIIKNKEVNVVDYKTKAPMSKNAILGKTKNASGNEFRQLVFYKLLLDRMGKWNMVSGEIDFLEPNASRKYKKERFIIVDEQVKELEILIHKVVRGILELEFWNDRCEDKKCKYCALRESPSH